MGSYLREINVENALDNLKDGLCYLRNESVSMKVFLLNLWNNGLVVKTLDSQSRGPMFKSTGWLQGRLSLSSLVGR